MRINDYFLSLERIINEIPNAASVEIIKDKRSESTGFFKAIIHFNDQKILHIREFVFFRNADFPVCEFAFNKGRSSYFS